MEININSNGFGNFGFGRIAAGASQNAVPATVKQKDSNLQPSNLQSTTLDALQGSEPVAEIPDAALSRDDALGKLVGEAFNLPPPPMPDFATTP